MRPLLSSVAVIIFLQPALSQRNIATVPSITAIKAFDGKVFVAATRNSYGVELSVSDGSHGNLSLLKDINPGSGSSSPGEFTVFNDQLFFTAYSSDKGLSLWKTDGTQGGTQVVYSVKGADPRNLLVFKGKLYFTTSLGSIMRTDGTEAGTSVFYQAPYTSARINTVLESDQYLFFTPDGKTIYRDDGTSRISFLGPLSWEVVYFRNLYVVGNGLVAIKTSTYDNVIRIYSISHEAMGNEEEDEWVLIKKLDAPVYGTQEIENFTNVSGRLFFSFRTYYDNVTPTDELWVSDGTEPGTKMVKSFGWDPHYYQSEMGMFFTFKDKLFFRGGNTNKRSLWTSDGTAEGTVKFHDVVITPPYNDERIPVLVTEEKFYFSGDGGYNTEVWSSDGTAEGTLQLVDVEDDGGSEPHDYAISNNVLYFVTSEQFSSTLWSTHPTADISLTARGNPIKSGSKPSLFYNATPGACNSVDLLIRNKGLETLYLGNILVTGKDFYLAHQDVPETIAAGESFTLQVVFNPTSQTAARGALTIISNDIDEPKYVVSLEATVSTFPSNEICPLTLDAYVKSLEPQQTDKPIVLSNSSIQEGQPHGSVIGAFTLPASASFTLVAGEGDMDNQYFFIDGNVLKSNTVFNFNLRALYSIRVRAISADGESEGSLRIHILNATSSLAGGQCEKVFEKMSFSYTALEANAQGHLFATTSDGKVLRSIDAGLQWEVVYPGNSPLSEITFKGKTGIAQGNSILLKSDDDGATWFQVYIPMTGGYYFNALATFFINEQEGYVGTEEGEIFFTPDGGRTWELRLKASWNEFRDLFFLSLDDGYAIAGWGDLLKTSDGGRSWSTVDLSSLGWNTRVRDIWFIDEENGFLISEYKFYSTTDGGESWVEVPAISSGSSTRIKFYDKQFGYLYGGNGIMYKTADSGKQWELSLPGISPGAITGIARTSGKVFIATTDYYYSYDAARALAVSTDEGVIWSILNYYPDANVSRIDFTEGRKGIVIGQSGLFKTTDNGLTWNQTPMDLTPVNDVHFIDENTVILLSAGDLYKSTDGGATTRKVLTTQQADPYLPAGELYLFHDVLFSVSWYALYRSDDVGETWELVSTDPGYYTQGMDFISPEIGYRVELFGSVQKTTDGGKTWSNIFTRDPGVSDAFQDIFFLNESIGYAGGDYLQRTIDGGVTWERINWPFYDIIAIHFRNENHGYVVTRSGTVLETNDAGLTWETIFSASTKLYDVQFGPDAIFLAGENGFTARMNTTPAPPSQPGYIYGLNPICEGDAVAFHIATGGAYGTQWSTTADLVEDHFGQATIKFPVAGEYTISAKHFNSCGISELRTATVQVSSPPDVPVIEGPNPVTIGEEGAVYTVMNSLDSYDFLWHVDGSTSASPVDNGVVINWSEQGEGGAVSVLVVDLSGCRAYGSLDVAFEVPLAATDELSKHVSIFPNPSYSDTQVASTYYGMLVVRIIDILGREYVRTFLGAGAVETIPTRHLAAGLYFIEITEGTNAVTKKLIRR